MATNLIAAGDTVANSADITVTTDPITIFCTPSEEDGKFVVRLLFKNSAGDYHIFGTLNHEEPLAVIAGPGVYRVTRISGNVLVDRS